MQGPYLLELNDMESMKQAFEVVGPDPLGQKKMSAKAQILPFYVREVECPAANILKQQMLSLGGEAAVARWAVNLGREKTDVLLLGTRKHYTELAKSIVHQPWGLKDLAARVKAVLDGLKEDKEIVWKWKNNGNMRLTIGPQKTLVMGILNVTPDSFSDGGRHHTPEKALERAREMVEEGADIIDVGGESTRPGSDPITAEEELGRIGPVLERLVKEIPVPISVDTYRAETAKAALEMGAHIINDVGGGKMDPHLAEVAAEFQAPVVIMHNKQCPVGTHWELVAAVVEGLAEGAALYLQAGLSKEKIMVDPGIGFGKDPQGNLALLKNLASLRTLGYPVLLGASRKSFINAVLDLPVDDRLEGSLAAAAWGVSKGMSVIRVHDVKETVRLVRVLDAIKNSGW